MDKKEFGKYISGLRKEKYDSKAGRCWSQKELAEKANVSAKTVGDIERGQRAFLDCETVRKLAVALELCKKGQVKLIKLAACVEYGDILLDDRNVQDLISS